MDDRDEEERGRILVVDDEAEVLNSLNRRLRREFEVHLADSAEAAFAALERQPLQVLPSDQRMAGEVMYSVKTDTMGGWRVAAENA